MFYKKYENSIVLSKGNIIITMSKLYIILLLSVPIFPDTLFLKSGKKYENVIVKIQVQSLKVSFQNQSSLEFEKKLVKTLKIRPVNWPSKNSKKAIKEERLRVAEILMTNTNWKPKEGEKPRLAILPFEDTSRVSKAEAKLYSQLIKASIIQKKVFHVVDEVSFLKAIREGKCNDKKCAGEIAEKFKANKLLVGSISRIGKDIYISGDVIDIHKRTVDFSETVKIESGGDIRESIEEFSRLITGGTLEYWNYEALNPYQGEPSHIPYLWRSTILPGFGQWHKNQPFRGGLYFSLFAGSLVYLNSKKNVYNSNYSSFENAKKLSYLPGSITGVPSIYLFLYAESSRNSVKTSSRAADATVTLALAIYLMNVIDAYVIDIPNDVLIEEGEQPSSPSEPASPETPSQEQGFHFFLFPQDKFATFSYPSLSTMKAGRSMEVSYTYRF